MSVRLISITESAVEAGGRKLTPEELIVYTARVSAPQNQDKLDTSAKLLKYLINNKHWSPLEMVNMCVEIKTSRAIAQQILRHRSFTFQEFSQRYAQATSCTVYEARRQDVKNRQNSVDDLSDETRVWFEQAQEKVNDLAFDSYQEAINRGIAKECARFLLPLSTDTTIYMNGSIRSWVHYLDLRSANGTQKEHMDIAYAIIKDIFLPNFPNVADAMGWICSP